LKEERRNKGDLAPNEKKRKKRKEENSSRKRVLLHNASGVDLSQKSRSGPGKKNKQNHKCRGSVF